MAGYIKVTVAGPMALALDECPRRPGDMVLRAHVATRLFRADALPAALSFARALWSSCAAEVRVVAVKCPRDGAPDMVELLCLAPNPAIVTVD